MDELPSCLAAGAWRGAHGLAEDWRAGIPARARGGGHVITEDVTWLFGFRATQGSRELRLRLRGMARLCLPLSIG